MIRPPSDSGVVHEIFINEDPNAVGNGIPEVPAREAAAVVIGNDSDPYVAATPPFAFLARSAKVYVVLAKRPRTTTVARRLALTFTQSRTSAAVETCEPYNTKPAHEGGQNAEVRSQWTKGQASERDVKSGVRDAHHAL